MSNKLAKPSLSLLLLAFAALLLGNLFAAFADVVVKAFGSASGIYQYLLLRQVLLICMILPFFLRQTQAQRRPTAIKLHIARGNLIVVGGSCVVVAVMQLPLATANVIFYTAPIITLLLAALWLQEPLHRHRLFNLVCCLVGAAVALRPDHAGWGVLAAFAAAFVIGLYNLMVRFYPKDISTVSVMFWGAVTPLPLLAIVAAFHWQPWSMEMLYLIVGSTICVGGYQLFSTLAYRRVEAGAIAIAEYSGLIYAAILGWWLFAETLDVWTLAGITLIILPMLAQAWLEQKKLFSAA